MSLGILTVSILGLLGLFQVTAAATAGMDEQDKVRIALENVAELLRRSHFSTLYTTYHGMRVPVPDLMGPDGHPAAIAIECFVNELSLPPELGPIIDIDGQAGLRTADCSKTYALLPVRLTLVYGSARGTITRELYLVMDPGN